MFYEKNRKRALEGVPPRRLKNDTFLLKNVIFVKETKQLRPKNHILSTREKKKEKMEKWKNEKNENIMKFLKEGRKEEKKKHEKMEQEKKGK